MQAALRDERADSKIQQKARAEAAALSDAEIAKLQAALDEASGNLVQIEQQSVGTAEEKDQAIRELERSLHQLRAEADGRSQSAETVITDRDTEIAELQEALQVCLHSQRMPDQMLVSKCTSRKHVGIAEVIKLTS